MSDLNRLQKIELGRMYYIYQGLTAKEAAEKVLVSENTFGGWVDKFGWKALKAGEATKSDKLISTCYDNIIAIQDAARNEKRALTSKEADAIYKISLTIKAINKEFSIDVYSSILQEFFNHIKQVDLDLAQNAIGLADSFFQHKIKQLAK